MHLLLDLSKNNTPTLDAVINTKEAVYNPETQITEIYMGGYSTSCHKSTDGTQPKNEADRIMDDM
jgi:hypothetical protein